MTFEFFECARRSQHAEFAPVEPDVFHQLLNILVTACLSFFDDAPSALLGETLGHP